MSRILLDVQVRNRDHVKALRAQVSDHFLEMREALAINRERSVGLVVVDTQIDDIGRNFLFSEKIRNFANARFGVITVAALLVTQTPKRRQGRASNKRGVFFHDFLGLGSAEKIIVQLAALSVGRKIISRFLAEI